MTQGELYYLVMVAAGFVGFGAVLAYYTTGRRWTARRPSAEPARLATGHEQPASHAG